METNPNKYFTVDFADKKDVEIISVEISNVYAGLMAGTRSDYTKTVLSGRKRDSLCFNLTDDQFEPYENIVERALRPYRYKVLAQYFISDMTVLWFDYAPPEDKSLKEIISEHVANINYDDYAEEIDW